MPSLQISCRDASRRGPSAPTNLIPISRLRGNSRRRLSTRLRNRYLSGDCRLRPRVRSFADLSGGARKFLRSRSPNEPRLWGGKPNVPRFDALIDRALSGNGSVVMLGGGPGVGKTRLAMEMAEYASRVGFRSVVGHCYERDEPFPFLPFVEILESGLAQAASLDDYPSADGGQRGRTGSDCSKSSTSLSGYAATAGTAAGAEAPLSLPGPFRGTWRLRLGHVRTSSYSRTFIGPMNPRWRCWFIWPIVSLSFPS